MLTESEALARILAQIRPLSTTALPLLQARGYFTAREMLARQPLPAFDNSAMDGYAVSMADGVERLPAGTRLRVGGEQPAGPDRGLLLRPGQAIRIFTGAPVPQGTSAVVMQEDVQRVGDEIVLQTVTPTGEFIRRAGADLARGQKLCAPGEVLTPPLLGLLASQGLAEVEVVRAPRVAILATGDELRPPGSTLGPGEIYESNGILLAAMAAGIGALVTVLERACDERADLDAKIAAGLEGHDAMVIAGGVSVGERDLVKERLAAAGVRLDLWKVRIKPGKPFLYGQFPSDGNADEGPGSSGTHVFGLPGNPVSAFVTFLLFVRPALLKLMGATDARLSLPSIPATAGVELRNDGDRPHYLRGSVDEHGVFFPNGRQESHALYALSRSRVLVRVEPETTVPVDGTVRAMQWE